MNPVNTPVDHSQLYLTTPIKPENILFQLAKEGKWDEVLERIHNAPHLVNATVSEGPDAGKTILWLAAFQCFQETDAFQINKALKFISKLNEINTSLNIDAAPQSGPWADVTVLWLLAHSFVLMREGRLSLIQQVQNYSIAPELLNNLIMKYPSCNINATPREGSYKGVTTFCCLMAGLLEKDALFKIFQHTETISDSPPCSSPCDTQNTIYWSVLYVLITEICSNNSKIQEYDLEFKNYCCNHVFKIIETHPNCNIHFSLNHAKKKFALNEIPQNAIETVLSLPLESPYRRKLLIYLIFAGAKLTKTSHQPWKEEYAAIQQKLKTVFEAARIARFSNLASFHNLVLPDDVSSIFALNIIWTAFPELQNFPVERLKTKILYGEKNLLESSK